MGKNLKGEEKVDLRLDDKNARSTTLLVRSVGKGARRKISKAYPGRCRASGKKGKRERGLGRGRREGSLCNLGETEREKGRSAAGVRMGVHVYKIGLGKGEEK